MKKYIYTLILLIGLILLCGIAFATKTTELDENTDPQSTDILYIVDDPGGTPASKKITVANLFKYLGTAHEITISSGVAALTDQGYFTIDTEGDNATDDLTQITGLTAGDKIIIRAENDARTVVVKNGANLSLCTGADFTLNNIKDRMVLQAIGGDVCVEVSRSSGGD